MGSISSDAVFCAVMNAAAEAGVDIETADGAETSSAAQTEAEEQEGQGILSVDKWGIIWSLVNILLLVILMRKFLFKPVNKLIEERTASVQNDIDSARKSREEAEELKEQYASTISEAKTEAQKIISQAREQAASEKQGIIQQSQEEAKQIIAAANKTIENERKKSMQQAQAQIADLAVAAASKIIGENMDDSRNRQLVDDFLSQEGADSNE